MKQPETIRACKLLLLIPIPQGKVQEGAKPVAGFQNVSSSGVHEFLFGSSVHSFLKYLFFCVSGATYDAFSGEDGLSMAVIMLFVLPLGDNLLFTKMLS